jgi:8-oxo-dGTP pyrophosphatase MutT (NUDIX family)
VALSRFLANSSRSQDEFNFSEPAQDQPSVTLNGKLRAGVVIQDTATGGLLGCHPTGEPAGVYDLSKGQVDEGEDVREAAARELLEETGISVAPGQLTALGRFPLRKGEIELFYVALPVDLSSLHCDSLIDNPQTPERIGLPEMDGYVLMRRSDRRGYKWMGAIERLLRQAAPKFPRLRPGKVLSSVDTEPWVVIYRGEGGELGWAQVRAASVSEAREKGRDYGPVQLALTVQGVRDILNGQHPDYASVNEALFDFVRGIRLVPVGSSYSVGRGNATGQYAVVDDESGRTVSYQDSLAEAEQYAKDANANAGGSELSKFPLSAIFRGYVQAKEYGYRGSVGQWMRDMGVEVASSRRMVASQASPASVDALTGFEAKDPDLEALLTTPIKDMPRYRFLLNDGDFQLYEDGTLEDLIRATVQAPGFRSFFSMSGGKPVGFYAYQQTSDSLLNIKAFSLVGEEVFNGALSRDLFNLVSSNVEQYNIEWYAAPENGANEFYKRVAWWYGAEDPTPRVFDGITYFRYFIPAGSVKLRGGHRKEAGASFRAKVQGQAVSTVLDLRGGDAPILSSGKQAKGFTEEAERYEAEDIDSGAAGQWGLEPVNSATAQELLDANDNPKFYHRADHLAATKAVGGSELVRCYANSLELRTKSEHFAKNQTYYRQWVLFKDFHVIAKDKKIPFEDAVDYSLNFGDVNIRCSCPSHKYHGFAYMGDQLQYLYGLPREKRFPKIRNPQLQNATCFVAGTLVTTKTGLVPIESLRVGDVALTHLGNWKPVVATWDRTVAKSVVVKAGSDRIRCTVDHPWFLLRVFSFDDGGERVAPEFVSAGSISDGDVVLAPAVRWDAGEVAPYWSDMRGVDGGLPLSRAVFAGMCYYASFAQVAERSSEPVKVYGIEVEEDHSYCVGRHSWAVKNCKHIHMALEEILGSKEKILKMFSEYYKRLPSVPADTMIAIPAPKDGEEKAAEPEVTEFEETGDVDVVLPEKTGAEQELEPEVISTEDPKSPGTVYVDTKLAEESLPEDQRFKYSGDGGVAADEGPDSAKSDPVAGEVSEEEVEALADEIGEASTAPRSDDEKFSTEWAWQGLRRSYVG